MNECRKAFCFHLIFALSAARRIALKKLSLLCSQTSRPLRGAIANQRKRFSEMGTIRPRCRLRNGQHRSVAVDEKPRRFWNLEAGLVAERQEANFCQPCGG